MVGNRDRRVRRWSRWTSWAGARAELVVCVLIGVLVAGSAPALALSQRGHLFAFSFASKGEAAGRLARPAGVAVNEASGDVYVVDAGNSRVERFGPTREFVAAWGWGVSDGKAEYEVCASRCKAGIAGEGAGAVRCSGSDRDR